MRRIKFKNSHLWLMVAALAASAVLLVVSFSYFISYTEDRQVNQTDRLSLTMNEAGRSVLANCQQIEAVKEQLRAVLKQSLDRLPTIAYYKNRPDELADAVAQTEQSILRFWPRDCYQLPAVKAAGIRK